MKKKIMKTDNIKGFLIRKLAEESGSKVEEIDLDEIIENFDLDSLSLVSIAFEIEKEFEFDEINPTIFQEYNTINKLSEWIQNQL
jgi:acyl carrier protein